MTMMVRMTGGLMLAYSALYTAHFIFDTFYDAQPVWTVLNIISAVGIVIALAVNFAHMRTQAGSGPNTASRLGTYALSMPTPPWPSGSSATGFTCLPWRRASPTASTRHLDGHRRPDPSRLGYDGMAALALTLLCLSVAGCVDPPAPTATGTPGVASSPMALPDPADARTSMPTAALTPEPRMASNAVPTATPGPSPTATPTPVPTTAPTPTPTSRPTATATTTATPTPEERARLALAELLPWFADPPADGHPYIVIPILEVWLKDAQLGRDLARAPWLHDGIGPLEPNAVYGLQNLYDWDPALARRILADSTEEPVRTRNVHTLNVLGDMTWQHPDALRLLQAREWFADGLSPEERAFVIVLGKVAYHDALYADLLDEWFTLATAVDLPLSGEIGLWAFGHDAVEGEVLGAMEAGALAAESVMASPFPVTDLIMLQVNAEQYGGGFGGVNLRDSMVLSVGSGWEDFAHAGLLHHEVAHYHLAFEVGPHWLVEGGANFVAAYRQAWDGTEDWDGPMALFEGNEYAGRRWCLDNAVPNVAALAEPGPFQDSCGYHLGQYLLSSLYNTVGEAAFSAAMAELHGRYLRFLPWPSEEELYHIFLKHTPTDREAAFLDVYRRLHGGTFIDGD